MKSTIRVSLVAVFSGVSFEHCRTLTGRCLMLTGFAVLN